MWFNPNIKADGEIRKLAPDDFQYFYDYEFVLKCRSSCELQLVCDEMFDIEERTSIDRGYDISEEKLAMLLLQYA